MGPGLARSATLNQLYFLLNQALAQQHTGFFVSLAIVLAVFLPIIASLSVSVFQFLRHFVSLFFRLFRFPPALSLRLQKCVEV